MAIQVGKRYVSTVSGVEVIVTRAGPAAADKELRCRDVPMQLSPASDGPTEAGPDAGDPAPVQLGKRYQCEEYGVEVLCTKPGDGPLYVSDKEMTMMEPRPLPSSD